MGTIIYFAVAQKKDPPKPNSDGEHRADRTLTCTLSAPYSKRHAYCVLRSAHRASYIPHFISKGCCHLFKICLKQVAYGRRTVERSPVDLRRKAITALRPFANSPICNSRLVARFSFTYFPSVSCTEWRLGGVVTRHGRKSEPTRVSWTVPIWELIIIV